MASGIHVDKAVNDVKECVKELYQEFQERGTPINDDDTSLNKFCAKLEIVLQHGQRDKVSLLGAAKNYWNYFCRCLASEKNLQGYAALKYAKSLTELKTSLGRGRAVVRYCLMHQCLAETLQVCSVNEKATSDYYHDWAVFRQPEDFQAFMSSLYDLNDVSFDLAPSGNDLDAAWPCFARKVFSSSWVPLSRTSSISSINSTVSQLDLVLPVPSMHENEPAIQDEVQLAVPSLERHNAGCSGDFEEDKQASCGSQTRPKVLMKSRSLSPVVFKSNLPESQGGATPLDTKEISPRELELKQRLREAESVASTCAETLAKLKEDHLHKEKAWQEREARLQDQLYSLQLQQSAQDTGIENSKSEQACCSSEHTMLEEMVKRLTADKEDMSLKNSFLTRKLNEVLEKLEDTEESLVTVKQSELELRTKVEKLTLVNEGLKNLVDAVKEETVILRQQVLVMDKEVENSHYLLEQKKAQCKCLEEQLVKVRSKCCETINASSLKDREIERLVSLVRTARRKLLARSPESSQPETPSKEQSPRISTDGKECDETLLEKILTSGTSDVSPDDLSLVLQQYSTKASSGSSNSELYEHCLRYLGSAMLHQESLIDRANSKAKDIVSTSHSINLQLHVLREVLSIKPNDEESEPASEGTLNHKETATVSEELVPPRIEGCDFVTSLFETLCRNHSKLQGLMQTESQLEKELAECRELNRLLSGKVHEQERKLCGFVQELDRTKVLLAGMEDTRYKLQTAKAVMRYELQEKKHLLHNLKQQLESTREDCVRVMRSNAESELEWRSLREEFQSRKKQDSQDSGVSDNGHSTREQTPLSSEEVSEKDDPDSVEEEDRSDSLNVDEIPEEGASSIPIPTSDMEVRYRARSQRLEYLEQQCQILYSSLVRSSERSNNLQMRLHSLLEGSNEAASRVIGASDNAPSIPVETEDISEGLEEEPDVLEDCDVVSDDISVPFSPECVEASRRDESLPEIRKKTLDTIVHRVKLERSQSEELISSLRSTIAELQSANERLRRQVLAQAEEKAQRENEMRQRASGMLRTERNLKSVQLKDITREREQLLEQNKVLETKLEQKENELTESDACRRKSLEKQKTLEKEVGTLTLKLDNQTTSHNHLYENYVTQQTVIEEMKKRIGEQEQMIGELEHSVEELKEDQVTEQTMFLKEVEKLQLDLASREEECSSLSDELKKLRIQADQDKEQSDHLKQQLEESSNIITSFEDQLKQLKVDSVELKKKIVKLVREKDTLWKQNDSLQFLQKLQATDKWMDNDEADSCLQCSTAFSFTLRKHHCRLCGRIFCHNCSNNWLMTTASSRPTRVCNACAVEHDRLERAARNPSVSTTISVESEEDDLVGEVNTPKCSDGQTSCNSAVGRPRQNTADSGIMSSSAPTNGGAVPRVSTPKIVRNWSFPKLRKLQFLQSSGSLDDGRRKQEFDIISDEEIARSLSACSPYNSSPSNSQQENTFHMSTTRTVEDIADCGPEGVQGEIWVNAGGTYGIPVLLKVPKTVLFWEFKCEPKSISFELKYKPLSEDLDLSALEVILPTVRVQADVQPMEGHLVVREAGVYVLMFDNQHSKFIAKKVTYKLHLRKPDSSEPKTIQT